MLNKKSLLLGAVAVALSGNVGAAEVNGLKFGGWAGFGYNYEADKEYNPATDGFSTKRGNNSLAVSGGTRVNISKDLGEGLSIATQFRTSGLRVASLNYTDGTNSISIGKDYYAVSGFGDITSSGKSAFVALSGVSTTSVDYAYGASYSLSSDGLDISLGYNYLTDSKDLFDNNNAGNNKFFGNVDKYAKVNVIGARADYSIDEGIRVGAGIEYNGYNNESAVIYKNVYDDAYRESIFNGKSKAKAKEDAEQATKYLRAAGKDYIESGNIIGGSLDAAYAADGLFALVNAGYRTSKVKTSGFKSRINVVVSALYGANGEFNTIGSVAKADNFVYGGIQYEYSAKDSLDIYDAIAGNEETSKHYSRSIGLILGYAPVDNVVVDAYAGFSNYSKKANVFSINKDYQEVLYSINTRISF
ncbi:MAG: hypothetical protein LBC92_00200 [Rickettsiales bacterium]|jgi:hypothetical protein|nr:hypothetical protein [Rickettsiales bacterium]